MAHNFLDFGEHIYAVNSLKGIQAPNLVSIKRFNVIKSIARHTFNALVMIVFVFLTGGALFLMYPLWQLIYAGQKTWILPMIIPGTTLDTPIQYSINLVYQFVCSAMATAGPIGFDTFFALCCCHHKVIIELIGSTLDQMEEVYTDINCPPSVRKMYLINFLKKLRDLDT